MIYMQSVPSVTLKEARADGSGMMNAREHLPLPLLLGFDGRGRASGIHSGHHLPGGKLNVKHDTGIFGRPLKSGLPARGGVPSPFFFQRPSATNH